MDKLTIDQLRTFITVAEEGSFSAAGRKLARVQSAISHAMAQLEAELGVTLWDRSTKIPQLTREGELLLAAARKIAAEVEALKMIAGGLAGGLEASVALALDAFVPAKVIVELCRGFAKSFPSVQLRLHTETLSAVSALVSSGFCQLGVVGPAANVTGLEKKHLASVLLVPVVAKTHVLAKTKGRIATRVLTEHVNIVLSERDGAAKTPDQGVLSSPTWRVADLATKHALLLGGLGWGNMPEHLVKRDLERGRLVRIRPAAWSDDEHKLGLSLVYRADLSQGPATRWLMEKLGALCLEALA